MLDNNFLESIRKRFERYETYYQILGLNNQNVTDEDVRKAYENMCNQFNGIFKNFSGEEIEEVKERIMQSLNDAYTALKTKDSRQNYQEVLDKIERKEEFDR